MGTGTAARRRLPRGGQSSVVPGQGMTGSYHQRRRRFLQHPVPPGVDPGAKPAYGPGFAEPLDDSDTVAEL